MNKYIKEKKRIKLKNKKLLKKYPFLMVRSKWNDKPISDIYAWTELDNMPDGWRRAFGEQMCQEIYDELKKFDYVHNYRIMDIKEKYGTLRWYDAGWPIGAKIGDIINKYEEMSGHICMLCGAPAKMTDDGGWVYTLCDKCMDKIRRRMY